VPNPGLNYFPRFSEGRENFSEILREKMKSSAVKTAILCFAIRKHMSRRKIKMGQSQSQDTRVDRSMGGTEKKEQ